MIVLFDIDDTLIDHSSAFLAGARALHLETAWIRDLTITMGLVDTSSTPLLLRLLAERAIDVGDLVTHRFGLHEMAAAYDIFERPAETGAVKVLLSRG